MLHRLTFLLRRYKETESGFFPGCHIICTNRNNLLHLIRETP